jgi:hypothetical protein
MTTRNRKPRAEKAPSRSTRDESLRLELIGVRAACISAMSALQMRGGIDRELGMVLCRMAVTPLDGILEQLEGGAS